MDGLSNTFSFSSFADLHAQLDSRNNLSSDDERDEIENSHNTLAASSNELKATKSSLEISASLPSLNPERLKTSLPPSDKPQKQLQSTDTIYLEILRI